MSPFLIHPIFRKIKSKSKVKAAGKIKCISAISINSSQIGVVEAIASKVPNCPTSPLVPIPAPEAVFVIFSQQVDTGPRIALARVGAIQICGRFAMLPTCSMEVPRPCAINPLTPLSRKLATANPIIWAQQPMVAAPAAMPEISNIMHNAAELMGKVSTIPTTTEITMPMKNGE